MSSRKLIEEYGRRFTPFSKLIGFIILMIAGILIVFDGSCNDRANGTRIQSECAISD